MLWDSRCQPVEGNYRWVTRHAGHLVKSVETGISSCEIGSPHYTHERLVGEDVTNTASYFLNFNSSLGAGRMM